MPRSPVAQLRREQLPRPTDRIALGRAGLLASPLCIGYTSPSVVQRAYEEGINFFFLSADLHWPVYEGTRRALRRLLRGKPSRRREIVVAVTSYVAQPEFSVDPFGEVLAAVPELEYIDVLIAGGAYSADVDGRARRIALQKKLHFFGARATGITYHDRLAARRGIETRLTDLAFVRFSAEHPGADDDLFPFVPTRRSTRVYNFKSMSGYVSPKQAKALRWKGGLPAPSDHYRFVLGRAALDGILCAPQTTRELSALLSGLGRGPLSVAEEEELLALAKRARKRR